MNAPRVPWLEMHGEPVKVWTAAQCRAADLGASWEEVDAMEPEAKGRR